MYHVDNKVYKIKNMLTNSFKEFILYGYLHLLLHLSVIYPHLVPTDLNSKQLSYTPTTLPV